MTRIAWLMAILFLAGCSGTPGEGAIEKQVAQQLYHNGSDRIYRLDNFEKLRGYEKDGTYVATVEYDLVFKKSYEQASEEANQRSSGSPLNMIGAGMGLFALKLQYGNFKAGEVVHRQQQVTLVKTDQGWMLENR
jgi:hypothetical protein